MVNDILADEAASGMPIATSKSLFCYLLRNPTASVRHLGLQSALVYMCSIGQLSPGAYFLRRNLFTSIVDVRSLLI